MFDLRGIPGDEMAVSLETSGARADEIRSF